MFKLTDVTALPGTRELLASAPSGQVAVVTSATRPLAEIRLRTAGLLDLVGHLVTANDIQRAKPDPQPYLCGVAKLQLAPHDCVVIEDAPNGVRSGKAAGARVIAVRTTLPDDELLQAGADWIVNDCASFRVTRGETAATLLVSYRQVLQTALITAAFGFAEAILNRDAKIKPKSNLRRVTSLTVVSRETRVTSGGPKLVSPKSAIGTVWAWCSQVCSSFLSQQPTNHVLLSH